MKKRFTKQHRPTTKEDMKLTIFHLLKQGLKPSKFYKRFGYKNINGLSRYLKDLENQGYVKNNRFGNWEILKELHKSTMYGKRTTSLIKRGHGFRFKVKIKLNQSWEKTKDHIYKMLDKRNIKYGLVGFHKQTIKFKYKQKKIWFCKNGSINIFFKKGESIFKDSAKECHKEAVLRLFSILRGLESILRADLKIRGHYRFSTQKQHYAFINNALARKLREEGHTLLIEIRDENGELWALIDNSYNLNELELVHQKTAIKDSDIVIDPFMNKLKKNPYLLDDLDNNHIEMQKRMKMISEDLANALIVMEQTKDVVIKIVEKRKEG